MKRVILLLLLLPFLTVTIAQQSGSVILPGPICGYLNAAGSPYTVVGDIYVPDNCILDIYEGVEIIFAGNYSLDVYGYIRAWGDPDAPVTFSASVPSTGWKGIHLLGEGVWGSVTSIFQNCEFRDGKATGGPLMQDHSGGAIYAEGHFPLLILSSKFFNNFAAGGNLSSSAGGGALAIVDCELEGTVIVEGCLFQENVSSNYGGAVGIVNSLPEFIRNDMSLNYATWGGAVFFKDDADAIFINNSVLSNTASSQGGAFYLYGDSDPVFKSTIIWGNMAVEGEQVFLGDLLSDPDFLYDCIQMQPNAIAGPGSGFAFNGLYSNNTNRQPHCLQAANGAHQLTICSSCIDAGLPDGVFQDPDGTRNDIGAVYFPHEGTYVQGPDASGSWKLEDGPIWMNNTLSIGPGTTLTIEPGLEVKVLGAHELAVKGKLVSSGTEESPILFTPYNQEIGWRGLRIYPESAGSGEIKISHTIIEGGKATGGESYLDNKGGGIVVMGTDRVTIDNTVIRNCVAEGEETEGFTHSGGAGLYIEDASPLIRYCEIVDNLAGDFGGGIAIVNGSPKIHHTLIAHNSALGELGGGGLYISGDSNPKFTNLTISGNEAVNGGGAYFENNINSGFWNTILAFNSAELGDEVYLNDDYSDPDFYYCDVIGGIKGFEGPGALHFSGDFYHCIDADPLFKADTLGIYKLLYASPCRDAGDPATRPDPDGTISDIGAFYFSTIATGNYGNNGEKILKDELSFRSSVYPNPCNANTRVRLEIPEAGRVTVKVFNNVGQCVSTLVESDLEAGYYEWRLSMDQYPKGMYLLKISTANEQETVKVIH